MAAPRRTKFEIERDRAEIARLYLRGWTQSAIGEKLDLSQQQISYDLGKIRAVWRESSLIDMNEAKARELASIDELERTYWQAWAKSCESTSTKTTKVSGAATQDAKTSKPSRAETTKREQSQNGNPAFLAGVERCIGLRIKIIGLEAPKRTELSGTDGGSLLIIMDV